MAYSGNRRKTETLRTPPRVSQRLFLKKTAPSGDGICFGIMQPNPPECKRLLIEPPDTGRLQF
jgi:hypothetical protein